MNNLPPPIGSLKSGKVRNSNLELYRIIVMLFIVFHHYVVNSGVFAEVQKDPFAANSIFMTLFGMWGKTGINCFVMITGWFMCKSHITIRKFLKLLLQVEIYRLIFDFIFCTSGYEPFTLRIIRHLLPVSSVSDGFTSAFILFFLFIPFLNVLIHNLTQRKHAFLLLLLLGIYTGLGSVPKIHVTFNYVTWFSVLYITMSYVRVYGLPWKISHSKWGCLCLATILLSVITVFALNYLGMILNRSLYPWYFVSDSNRILAFATAFTSFMWFKDLNLKYNKYINLVGASTFGVLLIHANSNAMRRWLWYDTLQNAQVFYTDYYALHAVISCLIIFALCIIIDRFRILFIESPLFRWIDSRWSDALRRIDSLYFQQ